MKNFILILGLISVIVWTSCGGDNILVQPDPSVQAAEDSATIVNYITDLGLSDKDSMLTSGVYYIVLDSGEADTIDESDIVTFHYTGKLLNDTIFDTTIQEVADSIRLAVQADTVGVDASVTQLSLLASFFLSPDHLTRLSIPIQLLAGRLVRPDSLMDLLMAFQLH